MQNDSVPEKTLEERVDTLEGAHVHSPKDQNLFPEKSAILAKELDRKYQEAQKLSAEDIQKAKSKGTLHGDPFFITE